MFIGVMSCQPSPASTIPMPERTRIDHTLRWPAIRETWAADADYKIFVGGGETAGDVVSLPCGDSYYETAFKVQAMCRWALEHGHKSLFKVDDDTYVRPERLVTAGFEKHDFVCRVLPATDENHPVPYPYGGCGYFLNERMMELAASDTFPTSDPEGDCWGRCNTYEDGWIGRVAKDADVTMVDDWRLKCLRSAAGDFEGYDWRLESPTKKNDRIAVCEFPGEHMRLVHKLYEES
jgi:Galactosyltransferase